MSRDRRDIVPLLKEYFPELAELSSDDVHGFLDGRTGLTTSPLESNGTVFDAWRQALAQQGYRDVWPYTAEQITTMAARGVALKTRMEELRTLWASRTNGKPADEPELVQRRRELEAEAAAKGYKPGWIDHVLNAEATRRKKANGNARV